MTDSNIKGAKQGRRSSSERKCRKVGKNVYKDTNNDDGLEQDDFDIDADFVPDVNDIEEDKGKKKGKGKGKAVKGKASMKLELEKSDSSISQM